MNRIVIGSAVVAVVAGLANARPLSLTHVDTSAGNTLGTYNYTGAGSGFGGFVGGGTITLDTDATNLYIRFTGGAGPFNDTLTIWLDTKAGGFTDATMNDANDGSRRALTNLAANADDAFDPNFLPDFGITQGGTFGTVFFSLADSEPDGFIDFIDYQGTGPLTSATGYAIPLATLGAGPGSNIDFMVGYISDSGYMSNESIPAFDPLQNFGNPGFGDSGTPGIGNFDRLVVVPTPGALALAGMAGLVVARRRRA